MYCIQYVLSTQCSGVTYYLLQLLAMLSFSMVVFYSAIETGLYSLYRKKVISAFKQNKKMVRSRYSFPRGNDDLSLTSEAVKMYLNKIHLNIVYRGKWLRNPVSFFVVCFC